MMKYLFKKKSQQSGFLIYMTIMFMVLVFAALLFFNDMALKNRTEIEFEIKMDGLALNISEAGLHETLAHFKRKNTISHFQNPQRDAQGNIVKQYGQTVFLAETNYVNFDFKWTCKNVTAGCSKQLDESLLYCC